MSNSGEQLRPDQIQPKWGKNTRLPLNLTPRSLRIIRLLASGKSKQEAAREVGSTYGYVYKLMSTPMAKEEFTKISTAVSAATIQQIAGTQSGVEAAATTALSAEIDATVLESIQKLRSIMNSSTTSPQAQAFAAKELLDLSQAKKRLALLDKGLEDGIEVSTDDIALLAATVKDLRLLHMANLGKDSRAIAERRFAATEEEILQTLPEEMEAGPAAVAANETEPILGGPNLQSEAAYPSTDGEAPVLPAPVIGSVGPTIDEMLK